MVGLGEDTCGGSLWILLHPGVWSCWIPVIALGGSTLCVLVDPSCWSKSNYVVDPGGGSLWIPVVDPNGSWLNHMLDPGGSKLWILVHPCLNPCGSKWWSLLNPRAGFPRLCLGNPGGSRGWILKDSGDSRRWIIVDPSGFWILVHPPFFAENHWFFLEISLFFILKWSMIIYYASYGGPEGKEVGWP